MSAKKSVTNRLADVLDEVSRSLPEQVSPEERHKALAEASRKFLGNLGQEYLDNIAAVCFRKEHAGAVPPSRPGGFGLPCMRCKKRIGAAREVVELIAPDRS